MKLRINDNQIKGETSKAVSIRLPNSKGETFWLPKSLIYSSNNGSFFNIYTRNNYF